MPGMTPEQLDRYLTAYAGTATAVAIVFALVRERGTSNDRERLLGQADRHAHRARIATLLCQEFSLTPRSLSAFEVQLVDRLVDRADKLVWAR